jgi:hypothetical protein
MLQIYAFLKLRLIVAAYNWTPDLVAALTKASSALARLDARILVSPGERAWALRASWTG